MIKSLVGFGELDLIIVVAVGCKLPNLSQDLIVIYPNCWKNQMSIINWFGGWLGTSVFSENTV